MTDHPSPVPSQDRIAEIRQRLQAVAEQRDNWRTQGLVLVSGVWVPVESVACDALNEVDRLLAENARLTKENDELKEHLGLLGSTDTGNTRG